MKKRTTRRATLNLQKEDFTRIQTVARLLGYASPEEYLVTIVVERVGRDMTLAHEAARRALNGAPAVTESDDDIMALS